MSGTQAELTTRALITHSPAVLVTRVEENNNIATDSVPLLFFCAKCLRACLGNTFLEAMNFTLCFSMF